MNVLEECVLLLCCRLGDSTYKPLTLTQFRELGLRVTSSLMGGNHLTHLSARHLCDLGYEAQYADHIINLLDRRQIMENYLSRAETLGIRPFTRISYGYPQQLCDKYGSSRPPVLFYLGDESLLTRPGIAVVGSRDLHKDNEIFAATVGRKIAEEGFVLVSGGANGADMAAQQACLEAGGSCVIFTPHRLDKYRPNEKILYISEDGYDLHFSTARAFRRNKLIHMQASKTFTAQASFGKGGTWQGCTENLKHGWSDLFVYDDGSEAVNALVDLGATKLREVLSLHDLQRSQQSLFD